MDKGNKNKQVLQLLVDISESAIGFIVLSVTILHFVCCMFAYAGLGSENTTSRHLRSNHESRYSIDISINRKSLILYEYTESGKRVSLREYKVGTAVSGIDVYPLGRGRVTDISFNPWWYPTPYSRQVFRKRGIELPSRVPPGHPLNYMGAVKISLSHRTRKGAIYRIHGNNNPGRVGRRVTGGCFVMYNNEALELAKTIPVGTEVNILP